MGALDGNLRKVRAGGDQQKLNSEASSWRRNLRGCKTSLSGAWQGTITGRSSDHPLTLGFKFEP